jgi:hypothetical protein
MLSLLKVTTLHPIELYVAGATRKILEIEYSDQDDTVLSSPRTIESSICNTSDKYGEDLLETPN